MGVTVFPFGTVVALGLTVFALGSTVVFAFGAVVVLGATVVSAFGAVLALGPTRTLALGPMVPASGATLAFGPIVLALGANGPALGPGRAEPPRCAKLTPARKIANVANRITFFILLLR